MAIRCVLNHYYKQLEQLPSSRALLSLLSPNDLQSLRLCISAFISAAKFVSTKEGVWTSLPTQALHNATICRLNEVKSTIRRMWTSDRESMAGNPKYNTTITGCTGQVLVGDNTKIWVGGTRPSEGKTFKFYSHTFKVSTTIYWAMPYISKSKVVVHCRYCSTWRFASIEALKVFRNVIRLPCDYKPELLQLLVYKTLQSQKCHCSPVPITQIWSVIYEWRSVSVGIDSPRPINHIWCVM